ncbi:MAG TPA: hypothetical protein DDZ89_18860, partial [Clostridiales bacterium]|nr:hypothetical protein [Clostridiales bacterium]
LIKIRLMEYTHIKISEVPLELYENNRFYDNVARINDILNSNRFIDFLSLSLMILKSIISTISVSLVLASFNPWLILLCLLSILPPSLARIIKGQRYYYMTRFQTPKKRLMNYYITLLTSKDSVKELRIFNAQNHIRDKWFDIKNQLQNEEWSFTKKHGLVQLFVDISRVLGFAIGIIICTVMLVAGQLTVGVFGAAITALENVQNNFSTVLILGGNIGNTLTQLRDLIAFYDIRADQEGNIQLENAPSSIQLKNVSFTYPDSDTKALDQITLEIHKGESISLLGMNGSGKSTLIKVILGLATVEK